MKIYWYLSMIFVSLLAPNLALPQEIENLPSNNKSFDITDLSKNRSLEIDNRTSEQNQSNTTVKKEQSNQVETTENETTTVTNNSCNAAPPQVQHPLMPPVEVAENSTEENENNAAALSLEKPTNIEEDNLENEEEKEENLLTISQAEITNYSTIAKADHFYRCGETLLAERFYREVKEPFGNEEELNREILAEAVYEAEYLLPGGAVYWRLYQESLQESEVYESKRIAPLKLLSEDYPEFIPGHLKYAEILIEDDRHEEALKVLKNAVILYPNEAPLVKAKIEADEQAENWLAASLTALQFAVFNQDHFLRDEFKELADKNLGRYQSKLQEQMTWNLVGNAIMGGIGAALMGNVFAPLSTIQTSYLLLQGESAIGKSYAEGFKNRLTLIEDPEVTGYINEIGQKLAKVAGRDEFEYEFYVVMDENMNAFALPGGNIFINAGAIARTTSEAEIAGLLAHE